MSSLYLAAATKLASTPNQRKLNQELGYWPYMAGWRCVTHARRTTTMPFIIQPAAASASCHEKEIKLRLPSGQPRRHKQCPLTEIWFVTAKSRRHSNVTRSTKLQPADQCTLRFSFLATFWPFTRLPCWLGSCVLWWPAAVMDSRCGCRLTPGW